MSLVIESPQNFVFYVHPGNTIEIKYTKECEEVADEIIEMMTELLSSNHEIVHLVLGRNQYIKLWAHVCHAAKKPIYLEKFQGVPITLLDQDNYLDVLPSTEDMLSRLARWKNGQLQEDI